jgi:hypothetical protein
MSDIKQRLRQLGQFANLGDCNRAADHIATQEKRIAELKAQIAAQSWQEPIGRLTRRYGIVSFHTEKILSELPDETILYATPQAPANAINVNEVMAIVSEYGTRRIDEYKFQSAETLHDVNVFYDAVKNYIMKAATPPMQANAIDVERLKNIRDKFHEYSMYLESGNDIDAMLSYADMKNLIKESK